MIDSPPPPPRPAVQHPDVDWSRVRRTSYHLRQQFIYRYPGPIADLRQRLVVVPGGAHGDQRLLRYDLEVSSQQHQRREEFDAFGNRVVWLSVPRVEHQIAFEVSLELERIADAGAFRVPIGEAVRYLTATPLTAPGDALRRAIQELRSTLRGTVDARVAAVNQWVFGTMVYTKDVTGVRTTAAEAFSLRAGVCQDYAHVMLAICRALGIPARYVSGHLLGEGGTHAWIEALVPHPTRSDALIARAFDPTHGCAAGLNYITIATGRDYRDVAPTTGTFSAPYGGILTARKQANVTCVEYADSSDQVEAARGAA